MEEMQESRDEWHIGGIPVIGSNVELSDALEALNCLELNVGE